MLERIKDGLTPILGALVWTLVCVGVPLFFLNRIPKLESMTATANDAEVTDVHMQRDDDTRYYTPTFTFEDSDHRTFEAVSPVRYPHDINVGETYEVRYDPYDPEAGCLILGYDDLLRSRVSMAYINLFIGIALAAPVVWLVVKGLRTSDSSDEASG